MGWVRYGVLVRGVYESQLGLRWLRLINLM